MSSSRYTSNGFPTRLGGHRKYILYQDDTTKIDRLIDQLTDTELGPLNIETSSTMTYCVTCDLLYDMWPTLWSTTYILYYTHLNEHTHHNTMKVIQLWKDTTASVTLPTLIDVILTNVKTDAEVLCKLTFFWKKWGTVKGLMTCMYFWLAGLQSAPDKVEAIELQWNLWLTDTSGTRSFVCYKEMSVTGNV